MFELQKKKKCDETSPICLACQSRNQECIWPDLTKNSKVKKQSTTTSLSSSLPTPAQSPSLSDIDQKRLNESILQRHNNTSSTNNKLKKIKNPNLDSLVREFASEKEEAMDDIGHLNMNVISCHK
ncbi:uncharacterized protein KGF55_002196 [Candida pseudojiufengensis]|uniref:uncharacterized protein n=1 Tax=Candida pseudojiufengensis TaxID=497109 RepID=UPI002224ACF3|nr:uncharacterized protein KGF55_002196 [Candida pseudojiufengensis]KAI5964254.1 hypothetical protein KGF55_002196 [Candida pseudojiufengensis]